MSKSIPVSVPVQINIEPESLNIITNDLRMIIDGIKKASDNNIFNSEETQMLCSSINNLGELVFIMAKSVENTLEKAEKIGKSKDFPHIVS
jgi:hypothetical protein